MGLQDDRGRGQGPPASTLGMSEHATLPFLPPSRGRLLLSGTIDSTSSDHCFSNLSFHPQTMAPWPEVENAQPDPEKYIEQGIAQQPGTDAKGKDSDHSKCCSGV